MKAKLPSSSREMGRSFCAGWSPRAQCHPAAIRGQLSPGRSRFNMLESEGQAGTETNTAPDMVEVEGLRLPRLVLWEAERILVGWCEAEKCRADREIIR